ncbi:MAG: hypothetical protein KGS72_24390 [Cyanobacteria bacterium REEB67]|nr:hypothetical protein [Cyanobacteria bacterium REEB67]
MSETALKQMKKNALLGYKPALIICGSIAILFAATTMLLLVGPMLADFTQHRPFDSTLRKTAAWTGNVGKYSQIRLRMVDDLLERFKLAGMSRSQIVDLLGAAIEKESKQSSSEYIYYLGPERGFISIDDEWLYIKFKGDIVVSAVDRTD